MGLLKKRITEFKSDEMYSSSKNLPLEDILDGIQTYIAGNINEIIDSIENIEETANGFV